MAKQTYEISKTLYWCLIVANLFASIVMIWATIKGLNDGNV